MIGLQCPHRAPWKVAPITVDGIADVVEGKPDGAGEIDALQLNERLVDRGVGQSHSTVDGHGRDISQLVIYMGAQRANAIGRKDNSHRRGWDSETLDDLIDQAVMVVL